jgi:hypothetical protein
LLAAGAAEAQKATPGQTGTGGKPAPTTGAAATPEATAPDTGATPDADTASTTTATAALASGNLIVASDPQGVATAMQGLGYTATLGADSVGDPMISGDIEGVGYNVLFYGCQENANCQWLIFSAGFDLPNGSTSQVINDWNANNLVGQAYLDSEQDPFINYFVTTTGGLTQENFADVVDWWKVAMGNFETAVGFQK